MTVEHSNDMEPASDTVASVPKKSKSTTSKQKKTALPQEETFSSAEKKKTPRPRKQVLGAKVQDSLEERLKNEVAPVDVSFEKEEVTAKPKISRPKKTPHKKIATKKKSTSSSDVSEHVQGNEEETTQGTVVKEVSVKDDSSLESSASTVSTIKKPARRGRPKKNVPTQAVEEYSTQEVPTPPSSFDETTGQNMPIVEAENKKGRRPSRLSKAKTIKETVSPSIDLENELPTVEHASPEPSSLKTLESVDTTPSTEDATEQREENASKSRRGRRGGRGKRGKKRPLSVTAQEQSVDESDIEEDTSLQPKVPAAVNVGKSSRTARMAAAKKSADSKTRKMFISMVQGEQVEVALVESGIVQEYYLEMLHQVKTKGNIYKGVVNNIDANLQAAFVNYGAHKNGFLQIDEIHPEYYQSHHEYVKGKKFPPIQKIIKPGQEILVQVVKEPTGNKGAFLTTWLSLPGRFLVLTPGQEQIGVSRKVDSDEERARLRELMTGIDPGTGLGVIVRTASAGTTKTTLKSDLQYLKRVWREIRKRGVSETAPALLYRESSLAERAIRDYLTDDVIEVWVDSNEGAETLREMVTLLFPRKKDLVRVHADVRQTLWERFNMQRQLEQIYAREVVLPSGGRLVFDQTEALMAIDINSGKISGKGNFESMALKTNIEAAEAIARHLKLRDIGGQVVIDFIEMRDKSHIREVEKTLRNAMKSDRARHDVARMSSFGLLEIVRQRTGSSALAITMEPCPHCRGTGQRRNLEWQALQALCEMERKGRSAQGGKFVYETSFAELALYLLNQKRQRIAELEERLKVHIEVAIK